ncbi:MAG: Rho termination factor N-terminal domain-containing protein, partial [Microcystis panniformis]
MVPEYPPLDEMTLRQLRRVASQYSISRYSRMRKTQLIEAITQAMGVSGNFKSIIKEEKPMEAAKFE